MNPKDQKLFLDQKNTKAMSSDSTSISKFNLKDGDLIYLQNPNVELKPTTTITTTNKPTSNNNPKIEIKEDPKLKCNHSDRETCINCIDKIKKIQEEKKVEVVKKDAKAEWDKLIEADKNKKKQPEKKVEEVKKVQTEWEKAGLTNRCNHGIGQKCLNCMETPVLGSK